MELVWRAIGSTYDHDFVRLALVFMNVNVAGVSKCQVQPT